VQLSLHADYSLRVLLYLGTHPNEVVTTRDISDAYNISKHHLVRVAQTLGEHGYVELIPGRAGGLRLAMDPSEIRLGDVVRRTEPHLRLVECFDVATNTCPITDHCGLRHQLHRAVEAFVASLNEHTLGDLLSTRRRAQFSEVFIRTQDLLRSSRQAASARTPRDARRRMRSQPERS
jgi:Rrf2 family nitric oxide-sensitive transcriptional repressor